MARSTRITESNDARRRIQEELRAGEILLWSGKPLPGLRFEPSDFAIIAFMTFWVAGVTYWLVRAVNMNAPFFFRVVGTVFLAVGLYNLIGRFFVDAWRRRRTFYGVTSDRVVVATGPRTRSRQLDTLSDLSLDKRSDGSGTIDFGQLEPEGRRPGLAFRHLEACAKVYDIIAEARSQARNTAA